MDAAGVTKYKAIKKYQGSKYVKDHDMALKNNLLRMTRVYQPSLQDILQRQENVARYLVPTSNIPYGAALGNSVFSIYYNIDVNNVKTDNK